MAAIGLAFFGLAWAIDVFLSTSALIVFTAAMLIGPPVVLEVVRLMRLRIGDRKCPALSSVVRGSRGGAYRHRITSALPSEIQEALGSPLTEAASEQFLAANGQILLARPHSTRRSEAMSRQSRQRAKNCTGVADVVRVTLMATRQRSHHECLISHHWIVPQSSPIC